MSRIDDITKLVKRNQSILSNVVDNIESEPIEKKDLPTFYLASINTVLEDIAVSLAIIADEIKEERQEREKKRRDALDKVLFSSVIPEEERKKMKEEFFESISNNKEEGKK